jgi:RNA polymerase sigma factor (sigma-70 family)
MALSDRELVELSAAGEKEAFAQLIERYQTLVCSVAYATTGNFTYSEDVGQEAFMAAWQKLSDLKDGSRFKSWISSITRNLAHNAMRHNRNVRHDESVDRLADTGLSPAEQASRNEECALVWKALSALPDDYREPLVLYYRQDHSLSEMAHALDLSTDVAKQRLSRGRKMLRKEVVSLVETTLQRTAPTRAFTLAVLAALPAMTATAAAAATSGSVAALAKSAVGPVAAKTGGTMAAVLGGLSGIAGASFGTWMSWTTARYQNQRDLILRETGRYLIGLTIFLIPFLAIQVGWRPHAILGTGGYLIAFGAWMSLFMVANFVWIFRVTSKWKQFTSGSQATGAAELPMTPATRWLSKWEGRRWTSRQSLLGLPLIDIEFSDPVNVVSSELRSHRTSARGWIAIGDRARGRLLAIGFVAIAPVAIGTMSIGILSFGVLSIGILSFGVFAVAAAALGIIAVGGWSIGGAVGVGYLAAGPIAIAWEAAWGPVAIAFSYADGAKVIAEHASDGVAKSYIGSSGFFQVAVGLLNRVVTVCRSPYARCIAFLLPVVTSIVFLAAAYRLKRSPSD